MKRVLPASLLCIVVLCLNGHGQSAQQVSVRIRFIHAQTRQAIRSATLSVRRSTDSSALVGAITNMNGECTLLVPMNGSYEVRCSRIGLAAFHHHFETKQRDLNLGVFELSDSTFTTAEVEVSGWRAFTEIHPDKKVFTVAENPNIVGATTTSQVLDQIPGLYVDENGTVRLRGTDAATILVNGRELKMEQSELNAYLQSLVADNVQAIEVKTAGSASDDARRAGGSINIITRTRVDDRFGGRVYINGGSSMNYSGGASVYYADSSISSSLGVGAQQEYNLTRADFARRTPTTADYIALTKSIREESWAPGYHLDPQIDWTITPADLLSISTSLYYSPEKHWESTGRGSRMTSTTDTIRNINDTSHTFRRNHYYDLSVVYKRTLSETKNLTLRAGVTDWASHRDEYKSSILRNIDGSTDTVLSLSQQLQGDDANSSINVSADFNWDPSKNLHLQAGWKSDIGLQSSNIHASKYDYSSAVFEGDSVSSIDLHSKVITHALYAQSHLNVSEDLSVQTGLRFEVPILGARFADTTIERRYPALFPNISATYSLSSISTLTVSYARAIFLPWSGLLNPRKVRETATSISMGNPDIRPEFMHNISASLDCSWDRTTLSIAPFFLYSIDEILSSGYVDGEIMYSTQANFRGAYNVGVHSTLSHATTSGLRINAWVRAQYLENLGSSVPGDLATNSANAKANISLSYEILRGCIVAASTRYNSEYIYGGDHSYDNITMNCSAVVKLLNDALSVNLSCADPFDVRRTKRLATGQEYSLSVYHKPITRILSLNLSYRWGNDKLRMQEHSKERPNNGE